MSWIDDSISQYYGWLKNKTTYSADATTGWYRISTPFLGLFNDPIEIFIKEENSRMLISDDGMTLENLELCGVDIPRSPKRREWLDFIARNYGVSIMDKEIRTVATADNFAQKKHNMICAIGEISSLEVTAKHNVASLFREDVKGLLEEQDLIYTPQFIAKGSTGIDFTFDFQIAGRQKETVIKTFNTLNKMNVPNFLFSWDDIKSSREKTSGKELLGLAIVNDIEREVRDEYLLALENKGADYLLWSERTKPESIAKLKKAS